VEGTGNFWGKTRTSAADRVKITQLRVSITVLGSQSVTVYVNICIPETGLKVDGDRICDTEKLPVALCLCSLETTSNMAPDEGHGDCCRSIGSKSRVR